MEGGNRRAFEFDSLDSVILQVCIYIVALRLSIWWSCGEVWSPHILYYSRMDNRPRVIFVHGLFSSAKTWDGIRALLRDDQSFPDEDSLCYEYRSPKFLLNPLRKIPNFDDLADGLRTFIQNRNEDGRPIILVSHSQGGLIVQRFLARSLTSELYDDIRIIKMIIMFACPNSGSDLMLSARKLIPFWRHSQEKQLRPLNRPVAEARRIVVARIVSAQEGDADSLFIPIHLYAGESDNVVNSVSAHEGFPAKNTGVIKGDHSSIIQARRVEDDSYKVLRKHIGEVVEATPMFGCKPADIEASVSENFEPNILVLIERAAKFAAQGQNSQARATYLQAISTENVDALQEYSQFQRRQGDLSGSIATSFRVIELLVDEADSIDNRVRRSNVMAATGISQRKLGELQNSVKSLHEAVAAVFGDTIFELDARAYAFDNLGITHMRGSDMSAARKCFYESLHIRERSPGRVGLEHTYMNIARVEKRGGNLKAATEACEKAMKLINREENAYEMANVLSIMGEVAYAREDFIGAEAAFLEALELNTATGRSVGIAISQQHLGRIMLNKGDWVTAETYAKRSLENYEIASNIEGAVGSRQLIARIASANSDFESAVGMLENCVTIYRKLGNLTGEAWSSFYLAEALFRLGRSDEGTVRLRRASALADSIDNAALRQSVRMMNS